MLIDQMAEEYVSACAWEWGIESAVCVCMSSFNDGKLKQSGENQWKGVSKAYWERKGAMVEFDIFRILTQFFQHFDEKLRKGNATKYM